MAEADLAGLPGLASDAAHQPPMRLPEAAQAQRQPVVGSHLPASVGERVQVVAPLFDIRIRLRLLLGLEGQEVDQGRLSSLDLRGKHGLLAAEGIDEPVERRIGFPALDHHESGTTMILGWVDRNVAFPNGRRWSSSGCRGDRIAASVECGDCLINGLGGGSARLRA
jgi:hypothetical protein